MSTQPQPPQDNHQIDTSPTGGKHYSIDASLELERQLDALSQDGKSPTDANFPASSTLDPQVLTSIIIQLRHTVADISRERDNLLAGLSEAHAQNALLESKAGDLAEDLESETQRAVKAEERLAQSEKKAAEAEEQLTMVRATVEESRRGIMRLQAESKRMSGQFSGAGPATAPLTSRANKRMSLNPASPLPPLNSPRRLNSHRRVSSLSDPGLVFVADNGDTASLEVPDRTSPPSSSGLANGWPISPMPPPTNQLQVLTDELESLRAELVSTRRALDVAKEAREASETCLRVLREFVASQNAGPSPGDSETSLQGLRLPPLPTDSHVDHEEEELTRPEPKKGWAALRLWREPNTAAPAATTSPAPAAIPNPLQRVTSTTTTSSSNSNIPATSEVPESSSAPSAFRSKFSFFAKSSNSSPASSYMNMPTDTSSISSRTTSLSVSDRSEAITEDDDLVQIVLPEGPRWDGDKVHIEGERTPTIAGFAM